MSEPAAEGPSAPGLPLFLDHLLGWYSITILVLGQRTGLLESLRQQAGTADELAERAGTDRHNTLAWLRAMAGAGHATHSGGVFTVSPELASILGGAFPVDAAAVLEFASRTPEVIPDVADAMRSGRGVDASRYHTTYGEFMGHINTPTYAALLVDRWIGTVPGLSDNLGPGGRIADIACGDGDAVMMLARAFPEAAVTGFDLDAQALEAAGRRAQKAGVGNVAFVAADARDMAAHGPFDLAICLDSWHHLGDPVAVGRAVHNALKSGGTLLLAESAYSGDLDVDAASPMSLIGYSAGLLYCVQESLAAGGPGLTPAEGPGWVLDTLRSAGYADVAAVDPQSGWRIFVAKG